MTPAEVVVSLAALVAATTLAGFVWRSRQGRVQRVSRSEFIGGIEIGLGHSATLVQFSSPICAPCVETQRVLASLADKHDGIKHVEIDIADRPDITSALKILQTPTTLLLDESGAIRSRFAGATKAETVRNELERIGAFA